MRTAILIPAYNEGPRLSRVLQAVQAPDWEVLVVNDGSTDDTSAVAHSFEGVTVLDLPVNRGKGAALWAGAQTVQSDLLVFLDADLQGLKPAHVEELRRLVMEGEAEMAVGLFRGGRGPTDFSHVITPWVSGQRAMLRRTFLSLPGAAEVRQGIEALLTRTARARGWRVRYVPWRGVTHSMKEEKMGLLRGLYARLRMYREVLDGLTSDSGPEKSVDYGDCKELGKAEQEL